MNCRELLRLFVRPLTCNSQLSIINVIENLFYWQSRMNLSLWILWLIASSPCDEKTNPNRLSHCKVLVEKPGNKRITTLPRNNIITNYSVIWRVTNYRQIIHFYSIFFYIFIKFLTIFTICRISSSEFTCFVNKFVVFLQNDIQIAVAFNYHERFLTFNV